MNTQRIICHLWVALLTAALALPAHAAEAAKPRIMILATGGTIAGAGSAGGYGYKSGEFKVEDLIKAVPNLDKLAQLSGEQVANIGSQDMNDEVWLKLAAHVNEALKGSRRRRRRHHAWHGHDGGDGIFPGSGREK